MSLTFIEKLENYRTDRPDEWTMDEFIRDAKKLQQERDELLAHCDVFSNTIIFLLEDVEPGWSRSNGFEKLNQTPLQSLAEIQAKAVFKACESVPDFGDMIELSDLIDYANKLSSKGY